MKKLFLIIFVISLIVFILLFNNYLRSEPDQNTTDNSADVSTQLLERNAQSTTSTTSGPINIFTEEVIEEDNTTYRVVDGNILFSNGFSKNNQILSSDSENFKYFNSTPYAKDSNKVFFDGVEISDADPISFEVLDLEFAKDKTYVYYKDQVIDLNSNEVEVTSGSYIKDSEKVFVTLPCVSDCNSNGIREIVGMDPKSMEIINLSVSYDRSRLYYLYYGVNIGDTNGLTEISNGIYSNTNGKFKLIIDDYIDPNNIEVEWLEKY